MMDDELRRPSSILSELDQLQEVINENRRLIEENPAELALQVNLMSLECREQDLLEELHESNKRVSLETFDIYIEGKNIKNHLISSSVLGKILIGLQGVVNYIAYALQEGPFNIQGPIPESIVSSSLVNISAALGGSFRVVLSSDQPTLPESVTTMSLKRLNKLLDCEDNKDLIKQEIKDLGLRTINKYKEFLEAIYKTESQIKMYDAIKPHGFETRVITSDLAERISNIIEKVESIPDKEEDYRGIIKGLNLIKYKFQFLVDNPQKVIGGSFDPQMTENVKQHFDTPLTGHFKIATKQNETTGELVKEYTLLGFIE